LRTDESSQSIGSRAVRSQQVWRKIDEVSDDEREDCEERLLSMAGSGMDPRQRDQSFWAELNQYLAYTYLRYKQAAGRVQDKMQETER
jgi:hypothetical protein